MNVAVLASTNGTDMDALLDLKGVTLTLVICNKECGALRKAERHGIEAVLLESKGKDREAYDSEIMALLEQHDIKLVVLIGYMRLLSGRFVDNWRNRIMNIHPSLLPAFAGGMDKDVHQAVLDRGCKVTGCTLHFVDEGADTGPIIVQKTVPVQHDDTPRSLKEKVQAKEQEAIREGVTLYAQGKLEVVENKVIIR